jgi:S1-C subfamily serine protease
VTSVLLVLALLSNGPHGDCPGWLGLGFRYQPPVRGHIDGWIYVQRLAPHGPSERAGLVPGDVITGLDGQPIRYIDELALLQRLSRIGGGSVVHLSIRRGTRAVTADVIASSASAEQCAAWHRSFDMARAKQGTR